MLESSVCVDSLGELGIDAVSMSFGELFTALHRSLALHLFMAGFLPGIFICLVLCVVAHFLCKKQGFEPSERAATEEKVQAFKDAILALLMPVIISYLH